MEKYKITPHDNKNKLEAKIIEDIVNEDNFVDKIKKQLIQEIGKKWESDILFATNSTKAEVLNFEDIENAIKLLEKNKTQVILLNYSIKGWFEKIVLWDNTIQQELYSLMWIWVINYSDKKFNFYFHWALKEYDEIIWIPKEWEIYIIDSKKILEFIS